MSQDEPENKPREKVCAKLASGEPIIIPNTISSRSTLKRYAKLVSIGDAELHKLVELAQSYIKKAPRFYEYEKFSKEIRGAMRELLKNGKINIDVANQEMQHFIMSILASSVEGVFYERREP